MPQIFQFKGLIDQFSLDFLLEVVSAGKRDDIGEWKDGERGWESHRGALVPLGERQIAQSGGTLTEADRTLYFAGERLKEGTRIAHENKLYSIVRVNPYDNYADFNSYTVKYVSAFNEVDT